MDARDGFQPVVFVEEIDCRPISKLRHNDREKSLERRIQVKGFRQHFAGLRNECKLLALSLVIIYVSAYREPAGRTSVRRVQRRDRDAKPSGNPVSAPQSRLDGEGAMSRNPVAQRSANESAIVAVKRRVPLAFELIGAQPRGSPPADVFVPSAVESFDSTRSGCGPRDLRDCVDHGRAKMHMPA
ncbi:MAG TPA: hypothetical protein VIW73_00495 [Candidatus Cybelea sp.]